LRLFSLFFSLFSFGLTADSTSRRGCACTAPLSFSSPPFKGGSAFEIFRLMTQDPRIALFLFFFLPSPCEILTNGHNAMAVRLLSGKTPFPLFFFSFLLRYVCYAITTRRIILVADSTRQTAYLSSFSFLPSSLARGE